jgi:hypothetical protein
MSARRLGAHLLGEPLDRFGIGDVDGVGARDSPRPAITRRCP